ncbi:MAG TPA: hypothetical protein VH274_06055 [Mycobacteriales bacterium]|nr:hypothetical protein [Mycobacteriales bacterium]
MTGALVGVIVLLGLMIVVLAWYAAARNKTAGHEPGQPDHVTDEVVTGVMAELRKWQAEAAHWKATAERLQRELDGKQ